jgi:outer membrane receptor protein involved in Fe transport
VGNHEPNRDDYTNSSPTSRPKAENLKDFEAGYRTSGDVFKGGINLFYMLYKNQLILTGALNDVGGATRRMNVDNSYRAGIELDGRVKITNQLSWAANATISTNKIKKHTVSFTTPITTRQPGALIFKENRHRFLAIVRCFQRDQLTRRLKAAALPLSANT